MMDLRNYFPDSSPQKLVGIAVSVSAVLLLLWLFMVSRMTHEPPPSVESTEDTITQERRDSVRIMMGKEETSSTITPGSSRIFMNAVTTFFVLMILLLGVWVWSRKKLGTTSSSMHFREIGQQQIAPGKQLRVIEINEEVWVLGIGSDSITLLHRYPKEEWKERDVNESTTESTFFELFSGKS